MIYDLCMTSIRAPPRSCAVSSAGTILRSGKAPALGVGAWAKRKTQGLIGTHRKVLLYVHLVKIDMHQHQINTSHAHKTCRCERQVRQIFGAVEDLTCHSGVLEDQLTDGLILVLAYFGHTSNGRPMRG